MEKLQRNLTAEHERSDATSVTVSLTNCVSLCCSVVAEYKDNHAKLQAQYEALAAASKEQLAVASDHTACAQRVQELEHAVAQEKNKYTGQKEDRFWRFQFNTTFCSSFGAVREAVRGEDHVGCSCDN